MTNFLFRCRYNDIRVRQIVIMWMIFKSIISNVLLRRAVILPIDSKRRIIVFKFGKNSDNSSMIFVCEFAIGFIKTSAALTMHLI